jgi:hypothetical protein
MMAIHCSMSKVTDYVNKTVDLVFKDANDLIALDPRNGSIDNDSRVKAIRGTSQKLIHLPFLRGSAISEAK